MTKEEILEINKTNPLAHCKNKDCDQIWWFDSIYPNDYQWICQDHHRLTIRTL